MFKINDEVIVSGCREGLVNYCGKEGKVILVRTNIDDKINYPQYEILLRGKGQYMFYEDELEPLKPESCVVEKDIFWEE